jgi:hypothetical protein
MREDVVPRVLLFSRQVTSVPVPVPVPIPPRQYNAVKFVSDESLANQPPRECGAASRTQNIRSDRAGLLAAILSILFSVHPGFISRLPFSWLFGAADCKP